VGDRHDTTREILLMLADIASALGTSRPRTDGSARAARRGPTSRATWRSTPSPDVDARLADWRREQFAARRDPA
jgi:hypothetical protein